MERLNGLIERYRLGERSAELCSALTTQLTRVSNILTRDQFLSTLRDIFPDIPEDDTKAQGLERFKDLLTKRCGMYFLTRSTKLDKDILRKIATDVDRFDKEGYEAAGKEIVQAERVRDRNLRLLYRDLGITEKRGAFLALRVKLIIKYFDLARDKKTLRSMWNLDSPEKLNPSIGKRIQSSLDILVPYSESISEQYAPKTIGQEVWWIGLSEEEQTDLIDAYKVFYSQHQKLVGSGLFGQMIQYNMAHIAEAELEVENANLELLLRWSNVVAIIKAAMIYKELDPKAASAWLEILRILGFVTPQTGDLVYFLIVNRDQLDRATQFINEYIYGE